MRSTPAAHRGVDKLWRTRGFACAIGLVFAACASEHFLARYQSRAAGVLTVGETFTNPAYAETLTVVACDWRSFYTGPIAEAIVAGASDPDTPGTVSLDDLAGD
jgi:gamma-glutamyltranspeptidase/glutathione hydrolase